MLHTAGARPAGRPGALPFGKARDSTRSSALSVPVSGNSRLPWPTTTGTMSRFIPLTRSLTSSHRVRAPLPCTCSSPPCLASETQLRRRCQTAVRLAPKALHRMLRFQGVPALVQQAIAQGRAPTDDGIALLALRAGYADQSHLMRECVRLTGVSPRVFL